jgi:hypothetical protein
MHHATLGQKTWVWVMENMQHAQFEEDLRETQFGMYVNKGYGHYIEEKQFGMYVHTG